MAHKSFAAEIFFARFPISTTISTAIQPTNQPNNEPTNLHTSFFSNIPILVIIFLFVLHSPVVAF